LLKQPFTNPRAVSVRRPIPAAIERRYGAVRVGGGRRFAANRRICGFFARIVIACGLEPPKGGVSAPGDGALMGNSGSGGRLRPIALLGAVALGCLPLANCSSSKLSSDKYSPRVIADGEPIPKGGGSYHVGEPYSINGRTYYPSENPSYRADGIASWYGPDFHGRLTANGEIFDMEGISAAHPTLPIPSYVRVTNLGNGRSMIVRVNDRGPFARDRVIDVSIGAAKALGFYTNGVARVRVEYLGRAPLGGSDNQALLATLQEGKPAQPTPQLMLASAGPFVPAFEEEIPLPTDRPFMLGTPPGRGGEPVAGIAPARSVARLAVRQPQMPDYADAAPSPATPVALGLMSGRGLY
jgi:rare lipoprotein A